ASLEAARRAGRGTVDLLEIRVDHFADSTDSLLKALTGLKFPLIVTVRDPTEGGKHRLQLSRRRELYTAFLPLAAAIDVELRNARALAGTVEEARSRGVRIVASFHDFSATPSAIRLQEIVRRGTKL